MLFRSGFFLFFSPYFARWAQYGLFIALLPLAIRAFFSPYFARWAQYGLLAAIARWAIRRLPGVALRLPRAVFWRRQMSISPRHLWRGGGRQAGGEVKFSHAIYGEQGERPCRSSSIGFAVV